MLEQVVVIRNEIGLHARPASFLVKEATKFKSEIFMVKNGNEYNCKSIMNVISMGAKKGDAILLKIDGVDEDKAIQAIVHLIEHSLLEYE
ncbi:HPr family phosphocarrier protein [Alkaliphilus hydrothermalis]|uniref:Phosphocarrier protein HPr n=1 Tax=Alkaliphilus hydrothermalis TaxID=1482730 RepID=A0ABS2NTI8_9FIRM|nr:HPr family phosphocarrier protein [Alkaliphilus hydrothermalis]MBM7616289.1 phosphocarrier protein [Alkaliphilus hydrothermalis]